MQNRANPFLQQTATFFNNQSSYNNILLSPKTNYTNHLSQLFTEILFNIKNKSKTSLNMLNQNIMHIQIPQQLNVKQKYSNSQQNQIIQQHVIQNNKSKSSFKTLLQQIPLKIFAKNKHINTNFINCITTLKIQQNQSSNQNPEKQVIVGETYSKSQKNSNYNKHSSQIFYSNQFLCANLIGQMRNKRYISYNKHHDNQPNNQFSIQKFQIINQQDLEFQNYVKNTKLLESKLKTYIYKQQKYQCDRKLQTQAKNVNIIYEPKISIQGPLNHNKDLNFRSEIKYKKIKRKQDLKKCVKREKTEQQVDDKLNNIDEQNQKINKLLIAQQKKQILEKKLYEIKQQIKNIKKQQISLGSRKQYNRFKKYQQISDGMEAKVNAIQFIRKLKNQRQNRQKQINNSFHKIDYNILEMMIQIQKIRKERDQKFKQNKKIDILQRMRQHKRKNYDQNKSKCQNNKFLNALNAYESKKGIKLRTEGNKNDKMIYPISRQNRYFNRNQILVKIQKLTNLDKIQMDSQLKYNNNQIYTNNL